MSVKRLKNEDIYLVKVDGKEDIEDIADAVSGVEDVTEVTDEPLDNEVNDLASVPDPAIEVDVDNINELPYEGDEECCVEEDTVGDLVEPEVDISDITEVESDPLESLPVIDNQADGPLFQLAMQAMVNYHDIAVLHHNIVGGAWYGAHEQLDEYYGYVADFVDDIIEQNIELGGREPSIAEAVSAYGCINVVRRNKIETFNVCRSIFNGFVTMIEECKDRVPSDVISKLEEYQNYFRKEAEYKMNLLLKGESKKSKRLKESNDKYEIEIAKDAPDRRDYGDEEVYKLDKKLFDKGELLKVTDKNSKEEFFVGKDVIDDFLSDNQ